MQPKDKKLKPKLANTTIIPTFELVMKTSIKIGCSQIVMVLALAMLPGFFMAQSKTNPFEIKQRVGIVVESDTLPKIKTNDESLPSASVTKIDSISASANIADKEADEKSLLENNDKIINPFEVDHVPVRKASLTRKAESFKSQAEVTKVSNGFLFWFLLIASALLAIVLNTKTKEITLIYKSIFNENILKLYFRTETTKLSTYLILLYSIFILNIGVFVYLVSSFYGGPTGIMILGMIFLLILSVYIIRHTGLFVFGNIFNVRKNTDLYSFTIMTFNNFMGLVILPINFFLAFGPVGIKEIIIVFSLIVIGFFVLVRTFRGIFIVSEFLTDRIFQIFIYLCAFEIAPVLILVKTVLNWSV